MKEFSQTTVSKVFGSLAVAAAQTAWGTPTADANIDEDGLDLLFPNIESPEDITDENRADVCIMRERFSEILEKNGFENFYTVFDDDWFLESETELADITTVFIEYVLTGLEEGNMVLIEG